jgi:hypothetical protein
MNLIFIVSLLFIIYGFYLVQKIKINYDNNKIKDCINIFSFIFMVISIFGVLISAIIIDSYLLILSLLLFFGNFIILFF